MTPRRLLLILGALSTPFAVGCGDSGDGTQSSSSSSGTGTGGQTGSGGAGTGGASGTGGSTTTGSSTSCTPLGNAVVGSECGIFVDGNAAPGGDGSQANPVQTLGDAVAALGTSTNIYVCAATALDEAADLPAGVSLYGGLDCPVGWAWDAFARTSWTAPAGSIPLTAHGGTPKATHIESFDISAASAVDPGQSSTAVVLDGGLVELVNLNVTAGDGADGETGPMGAKGTDGGNGAKSGDGGAGATSPCGADGGAGGFTAVPLGAWTGKTGLPDPGLGGPGGAATTNGAACEAGTPGTNATIPGNPGAAITGLGTLTLSGYVADTGSVGANGPPAGGGGGGGGNNLNGNGLRGGGGGAGGCGGNGGGPGTSGGSSIAIVSLDATITFEDVTASVGNGGNGGDGGPGGQGGDGGMPGTAGAVVIGGPFSCPGGGGAKGGTGGPGSGGRGGHAFIVAHTGSTPSSVGLTATAPMAANRGAGAGSSAGGDYGVFKQF